MHDLLLLCGLDDPSWQRWRDVQGFQGFFARLQAFPRDRQARTEVMTMTRLAVDHGAPELHDAQVPQHWSPFAWKAFVAKVKGHTPGLTLALQQMAGHQAEAMSPYLADSRRWRCICFAPRGRPCAPIRSVAWCRDWPLGIRKTCRSPFGPRPSAGCTIASTSCAVSFTGWLICRPTSAAASGF